MPISFPWDNPVSLLVQRHHRAHAGRLWGRMSLICKLAIAACLTCVVVCFIGPTLELAYQGHLTLARQTFWSQFALIGVALPWTAWMLAHGGISALKRGRCLEEMVSSGVAPSAIVDGVVQGAIAGILPASFACWIILVAGSAQGVGLLSAGGVSVALWLSLAWWPVLMLLSVLAAYGATAAGLSQPSDRVRTYLRLALGAALTLVPMFACATYCPEAAGPVALLGPLLVLLWQLTARSRAIGLLTRPSEPGRWGHRRSREVSRFECSNPIVVREWMRQRDLIWPVRHWDSVASLLVSVTYGGLIAVSTSDVSCVGVAFIMAAMLVPARATFRIINAISKDRESQTLDALYTTRITTREMVEGALRVGCARPLAEAGVLGTVVLAGEAWANPAQLDSYAVTALIAAPVLLLASLICSYAAVGAAASTSSRRGAWLQLMGTGFACYFIFAFGMLFTVLTANFVGIFACCAMPAWALVYPLAMLFFFRKRAYRSLSQSPTRVGFCA